MPSFERHCADCEREFGWPFCEVHRWLDEYAREGVQVHRVYRHHREGVEKARELFGDSGAKAAEVHILADWKHIFPQIPTKAEVEELCLPRPVLCPCDSGKEYTMCCGTPKIWMPAESR